MIKILKKYFKKAAINKVHIFIDGSWLYRVCITSGALLREVVCVNIDFNKLKSYILEHIKKMDQNVQLGDCYYITSIFDIPNDIDSWVNTKHDPIVIDQKKEFEDLSMEEIEAMGYGPEPALGDEDTEEGEAALKAWEAENEQLGQS